MDDIAGQKILNAFRDITKKSESDTLIFGTVKSVSPLKIEIKQGVIIPESHLFLGQMCRPHKVTIPHTHEYNGKTEKATAMAPDGDLKISGQATGVEINGHSHKIEKQVTEDVHKKGTDFEESVTIEIEPKLKNGDRVLMFAFNNFQMFYVAERIEEE